MREASEGRARLEEVDHETFTRFAEYLYGGDYNPAEALIVLEQKDPEDASCDASPREPVAEEPPEEFPNDITFDEPVGVEDGWAPFSLSSKKKKKKEKHGKKSRNPKQVLPLEALADFPLSRIKTECFPYLHNKSARNDDDLMYDYSEVLSHVKLYAFAEKYQMDILKKLVLSKLHHALSQTNFHPQRMHEFLDILALAYDSTPDSDDKEPLRDLLTLFGAWHFQDLVVSEEFQHLIANHGHCVAHLCQKVARRL